MTVNFRRRFFWFLFLLLAVPAVFYGVYLYDVRTLRGEYASGWALFSLFTFLLLFGVRKKITVLPLGKAYTWAQLHVYVGLAGLFVYGLHVESWIPSGPFELVLGVLAVATLVTGILVILLNRLLPPVMNRRGERIFLSRILSHQTMLRREAEKLAFEAIQKGAGEYFGDFYKDQISPYFSGIQEVSQHLVGSTRPYERWERRLSDSRSYISSDFHNILDELGVILTQKMDLDFQYVSQLNLKATLAVHIVLASLLLIAIPLHVVLVYSFRGG